MSRQRFIDPKIWTSPQFIALSDGGRLLFIGIVTTADDYGRHKAHPGLLKADIFPLDVDRHSVKDVAEYRAECAAQDLIRLWTGEDGQEYLWLPTWVKYQTPKYKAKPKLPEPPESITGSGPSQDQTGAKSGTNPDQVRQRGCGSGSGSGSDCIVVGEGVVVVPVAGAGAESGQDQGEAESTAPLPDQSQETNDTPDTAPTEPEPKDTPEQREAAHKTAMQSPHSWIRDASKRAAK